MFDFFYLEKELGKKTNKQKTSNELTPLTIVDVLNLCFTHIHRTYKDIGLYVLPFIQ